MSKENLIALSKEMMAAPSCCAHLKEKAQAWIDNPNDKVIASELVAELEADITPIDGLVAFAHSPHAVEYFGEEGAKKFAAHADELKSSGAKYCDCGACAPALKLLENKSIILG